MDSRVFLKGTNDHGLHCLWESSIIELKMLHGCATKETSIIDLFREKEKEGQNWYPPQCYYD